MLQESCCVINKYLKCDASMVDHKAKCTFHKVHVKQMTNHVLHIISPQYHIYLISIN